MYPFLLVLSLAIFAAVVLAYVRSGFASVFHPVTLYLLFHGFVFVVRPMFAYAGNFDEIYFAYRFRPSPETKIAVLVCANLGLLAFVAGAWRSGGVPLVFRQSEADVRNRKRLIPPFLLALALLAPVGLASLLGGFNPAGWTMRLDQSVGINVNTQANGWLIDAQLLMVPISVLIAWVFRFRWWTFAPLIGFVLLRAQTGGRGPFVVACVAAGMLWLFDRKRKAPTVAALAAALVLGAGFYAVGQDRGASVRTFLAEGKLVSIRTRSGFMESMDFANMEFMEYLVETIPKKTGTYGYFLDNLQVFTEPVPRIWWPGKPVGAPIKLYNLFDYGYPIGMTNSLPGEGWAQAGYAGVVIWCGLWGLILGAIYARFARSRQSNFAVALYFSFLPLFVVAYRDGLLLTVIRSAVFYVAPTLTWMAAARFMGLSDLPRVPLRRTRRRRAEAPVSEPRSPRSPAGEIVPRAWRRKPDPAQPAE